MQWFRYYVEALNDPKVQLLSSDLFRSWINLLCIARQYNGKLPPTSDVAFKLRISEEDAARTVRDLAKIGLFDEAPDGTFKAHNWNNRQYQSDVSTSRVKRHREGGVKRCRERGEDAAVTAPEQSRDRAETEQTSSPFDESLEPITFDEWLDWEAFLLWVFCSLNEERGAFPMIVKEGLDARCPGFLEAERKRVLGCIKEGERYSFLSEFMPGLVGWGYRVVFRLRPVQMERLAGTDDRVQVYSRDPRHARMHAYLSHLDKSHFHERLNAGEVGEYPTFEEWREAAWAHPEDCAICQAA